MIEREFGDDSGVLYEGTIVDFHPGWELGFERKFGKDGKGRKKIAELIRLINQKEENSDWEAQIGELVDLPSFYTFWVMETILGHWDGYAGNSNNYFFYLNPETDRFHFVPWGIDALFVEKGKLDKDPNAPISVRTIGLLANRLYEKSSSRERYEGELRRLLAEVWDEDKLITELTRVSELITPFVNDE
jgi:spore coat protein H